MPKTQICPQNSPFSWTEPRKTASRPQDSPFSWTAALTLAIAFLACFVTTVFMVARVLQRQSEENCSNPEDFPHRYASRVIWMPLAHLGISWAIAFIGTPRSISLGVLALSVFSLVLLISILSPHRALPVEELETADDALVMQSRLGGFFSYVNHCRLAHAARLQVTHPDMPIGEVIVDSGFGSRTTYYKIRKQLEN